MNEQTFIRELQSALGGLPLAQQEDILAEYRSHFFEGKERGKSEEEISKALGEPRTVARAYLADYHFAVWKSPDSEVGVKTRVSHLVRAVFVTLSLLFFNFFFMLVPIFLYMSFLFTAWILAGVLGLVGFIFFFIGLIGGAGDLILNSSASKFAVVFYSIGSVSLAVLVCIGLYWLTELSVRGLLKYLKMNIKLVTE